jgi:hypothetical protein
MAKYNAAIEAILDQMPFRIKNLPVSDKGFPVPWFVSKRNGEWDFVAIDAGKPMEAHRRQVCFVCGERLGAYKTFAIGPMCVVNHVTSEPSLHIACAEFSAKSCPFLINPRMRRNFKAMPKENRDAPGMAIDRNPGVVCLWTTRSYVPFRSGPGYLFELGEPTSTSFWAQGRKATRAEVDHSVTTGLPILRKVAEMEGADAVAALDKRITEAEAYWPEEEKV